MATPYSKCFEVFLRMVNDSEILYPNFDETEEEYSLRLENTLFELFNSSMSKFFFSQTPLDRDDILQEFHNDLTYAEIEIIGMYMLREYYRKKLNFLAGLKGTGFSDKDFKSHEPSGKMNQYRQLLKELEDEINIMIIKNSFVSNGSFVGWWE